MHVYIFFLQIVSMVTDVDTKMSLCEQLLLAVYIISKIIPSSVVGEISACKVRSCCSSVLH